MERALVIGASGGIGTALCAALADRLGPGAVTALSRRDDGLDLTDEASIAQALGALSGPFDLILVATGMLDGAGQPPEKTLKVLAPEALAHQFAVNAVGPLLVLKHAVRLMPRERRAVFAALSARVGSIGDNRLGGWYSYRMAKAALNQGLHTAAIELARSHPHAVCVALHPGTVATRFTAEYAGRHRTVAPAEAASNLLAVIDGLGPEQTGGFFDWSGQRVPW
ncbi:SDR family NAD(P)-dependent oxidoreductase [Rhodovulum euryhalinum]|uniref:NAD(P)-dependent dehydrogenase (Short-subunit alcohol dehydrogenase family) n=1 Tax=Rhodovulum euryhalinum TaxID=35805 RepID=A0A4R2KMM4_9RHOB|nr:SDR family NAD(P)-dependent oxidoreductase [Rhodovulum euryhalinum]TCO73902.1 NAD(P)-dependent dehydrogenase (short-subunit alcohol dehydrogenase family) [Rhodovulum euryhalinum]